MIGPVKVLLWLLSLLPASGPYRLAALLAGLWSRLSPGKRRVAEINLARCYPEWAEQQVRETVAESFVHYVATVLETGRNWYQEVPELVALCDQVVGQEVFDAARQNANGTLLLAPHFGAWEYLGMYLQQQERMAILYKPPADPRLEEALLAKRRRGSGTLLAARPAGLRQLISRLRDGWTAGVLPDQQPSAGEGRFAPFFGIPALTAVLAPRLIQRTGCSVVYGAACRLPNGHYRVHFLPAEEDTYSADLDTALAAVNRGVERCIAIDPAQYLWSYKRFRSQPDGEPPFYSEVG